MALSKELKGRPDAPKSPRDIAAKIVAAVAPNELIEKVWLLVFVLGCLARIMPNWCLIDVMSCMRLFLLLSF